MKVQSPNVRPRSTGQHLLLDRLAGAPGGGLPVNALTGPEKAQMKGLALRGDVLPNEAGDTWLITPAGRMAQEIPF